MYSSQSAIVIFVVFVVSASARIAKYEAEPGESVFTILPGIELVGKSSHISSGHRNFQSTGSSGTEVLLNHALDYLGTHDVNLKLNNLMNSTDVNNVYKKVIETFVSQSDQLEGK